MKRIFKSVLATLIAASFLVAPALAGPYEDGDAAHRRGDYAEAAALYRIAADQGVPKAQHNLGRLYYSGKGVPQDYAKAAAWVRKAAEQGDADSYTVIGSMYSTGRGVPKDFVEAYKWLSLAADRGDQKALEFRNLADKRMTQDQITEAQRLARDWKPN